MPQTENTKPSKFNWIKFSIDLLVLGLIIGYAFIRANWLINIDDDGGGLGLMIFYFLPFLILDFLLLCLSLFLSASSIIFNTIKLVKKKHLCSIIIILVSIFALGIHIFYMKHIPKARKIRDFEISLTPNIVRVKNYIEILEEQEPFDGILFIKRLENYFEEYDALEHLSESELQEVENELERVLNSPRAKEYEKNLMKKIN